MSRLMGSDPKTEAAPHEHAYQPNGLVREAGKQWSPVTEANHVLYDKVSSVGLCACGDIQKKHIANENVRSQAEQWRRDER